MCCDGTHAQSYIVLTLGAWAELPDIAMSFSCSDRLPSCLLNPVACLADPIPMCGAVMSEYEEPLRCSAEAVCRSMSASKTGVENEAEFTKEQIAMMAAYMSEYTCIGLSALERAEEAARNASGM